MLKLPPPRDTTETRTHEPTGVSVTFRRIGHVDRVRLFAASTGVADIVEQLLAPGVGIVAWSGVQNAEGDDVPYSLQTLEQAVDAAPDFGGWLNDELLLFNKLAHTADGVTPDDESEDEKDAEGNALAGGSSSTIG